MSGDDEGSSGSELGEGIGLHHWEVIHAEREQEKYRDEHFNTAVDWMAQSISKILYGMPPSSQKKARANDLLRRAW